MPPKKGGKKKKGKDKGKVKEPVDTITFNEAVMTYQLEVKLKEVDELKEEIESLKLRNATQKQRNEFLIKEQNEHLKTVLGQARELTKKEEQQEKIPYQHVETALHQKLASIKLEENDIEEKKLNVVMFDQKIRSFSKTLEELKNYKEHGQHVDRTHIEVLNKEIEDMGMEYTEISEFFEKSLVVVKNDIMKKNEVKKDSQKQRVTDRAIKNLNKNAETEIIDNRWLHKEVEIHRTQTAIIEKELEGLEEENIAAISKLFEGQLYDADDTRRFYLACKEADGEISADDGECCIEPKAIKTTGHIISMREDVEEIIIEEGKVHGKEEQPPDWLDHYVTEFDDAPDEEEYTLGPLETSLLCVFGKRMEINANACIADDRGRELDGTKKPFQKFVAEQEEVSIIH